MNPARARELTLALTAAPSVTDTDGETRFAFFLRDLLAEWPYFKAHPERLSLIRTVDDRRERYALLAVAGAKPRGDSIAPAVILTGHYDVVGVENYGLLSPLAFDPEALASALVASLEDEAVASSARGQAPGESERRALEDLRSGSFLPGRGLLDMKAGLAAGLAVLEEFAAGALRSEEAGRDPGPGALAFLAVPDEEGSSRGMLSSVRALPGMLAGLGLEARAAINLDAAVDQGDGSEARAVFLGSVGKLHPFALFVGRQTHAGAPFDGANPALFAAEFARRAECSSDVFDRQGNAAREGCVEDPPPPPTILYFRELRKHYDVTTPEAVLVSLNVLTHRDGPEAVLGAVSRLAREAMDSALTELRHRAAEYSERVGHRYAPPDRAPRTMGWAELEAAAGAADAAGWDDAKRRAGESVDAMGALCDLAIDAVRLAGVEGPAAIIGLAPPYYPRAALDPARDSGLIAAVDAALDSIEADGYGRLALRPYFPGISDMSYLYPRDEPAERLLASEACPLGLDPLPTGFSCPVVNIGPWGREYHQRLERVHSAYAFDVLPRAVERVAMAIVSARSARIPC